MGPGKIMLEKKHANIRYIRGELYAWHTYNDAFPTPQRIQMWVQVEGSEKGKSRGTLPSSQHFEG
jgi:hypothetical protein